MFRKFDPEPFAAASLGQVHRAVTRKGEKVAVKIQYPAIRSAIESDFKLLRSATLPTQLTGHVPAALIEEIQRGILEETDYLREADNLEFFRKGLSGLEYMVIPRVYRELSTDRVLTMSLYRRRIIGRFSEAKTFRRDAQFARHPNTGDVPHTTLSAQRAARGSSSGQLSVPIRWTYRAG